MIAALLQTQAQRRWQEFCQASQEQNIAVPDEPELINTAQQVFAFSDFETAPRPCKQRRFRKSL